MDKYVKKGIIGAVTGIALMSAIATSAFVFNSEPEVAEAVVAGVNVLGAIIVTVSLLIKSFNEPYEPKNQKK